MKQGFSSLKTNLGKGWRRPFSELKPSRIAPTPEQIRERSSKHRPLNAPMFWYFVFSSSLAMASAIFFNFYLSLGGWTFSANGYLYWLLGLYLHLVFLIFPAFKTGTSLFRIPWYDYLLSGSALAACLFCAHNSLKMGALGWEVFAPWEARISSLVILVAVLEAARRTIGGGFFFICVFFAAYPLFANYLPLFLYGRSFSFWRVVSYHVMGPESVIGLPMRTTGTLLIGFMVFAVALINTGAGNFFLELAQRFFGSVRGGAAKVSICSSAFMGSISGSVMSNVLTTGPFTIKAMKRSGYSPSYAAAVEACASSGGTMMPPIMGAVAFVMAEMLQVPYLTIIVTAAIPSILYYTCLFFQVDAHAALHGIKGSSGVELPSLSETMKKSWIYIFPLLFLIYIVVYEGRESQAPWLAALLLITLCFFNSATRLDWKKFVTFLEDSGKFMAEVTSILAACGLVVGSMVFTGMAGSFASEIISFAGNNAFMILLLGALASFVLGMGMTVTACYIFLALVMAPALIQMGFNPLAVHFFILYWGVASFITPPVAIGTFAAATVARSDPMESAWQSMRLGVAKYFLPFFFVLEPALIGQGSWTEIVLAFITCLVGVALIGGAMEGYLLFIGALPFWSRAAFLIAGMLLGYPEKTTDLLAVLIVALSAYVLIKTKRNKESALSAGP